MLAVIHFYSVTEPYGAFSNFAPYPIVIGHKRWPSSEHYFQAQKYVQPSDQELIRRARTPAIAARLGRDRRRKIRRDWDTVRVSVMREALAAKFEQHPDLRELLLSTADARLIEHTTNDDFWGDAGDGSGANMLGHLLMELRERLQIGRL